MARLTFTQTQVSSLLDLVDNQFSTQLGKSWSAVSGRTASNRVEGKISIWNGQDTFALDCNATTCQITKLDFGKKSGWGIPFLWGCSTYNPHPDYEEVSIGKFNLPDTLLFDSTKDSHKQDQHSDAATAAEASETTTSDADTMSDRDLVTTDITKADIVYETTPETASDTIYLDAKTKEDGVDTQVGFDSSGDVVKEVSTTPNPYCVPKPPLTCIDPNKDGDLSDAIIDPILRVAIQQALGTTTISAVQANKLTSLKHVNDGIETMAGLQCFTQLQVLNLHLNGIKDLSPLQGLTQLQDINLSNNQSYPSLKSISDLTPLLGLTKLLNLDLSVNYQVKDLTPLQCLPQLKKLVVSYNQVSDITPLQNLTQLTFLHLYYNQISDLTPLQGLTQLQTLEVGPNKISDVSPLKGLTQLQTLGIECNNITDLTPLKDLIKLKYLIAGCEAVADVGPYLPNPPYYPDKNKLIDLTPLQGMTELVHLDLTNIQTSDITLLQNFTQLHFLHLSNNNINNITGLIQNPGIGVGDVVHLYLNPVPATQIKQLRDKGVGVCFEEDVKCPSK